MAMTLANNPYWDLSRNTDLKNPWVVEPRIMSMVVYVLAPLALLWVFAGVTRWIVKGFSRDAA
jgi:hypothetical protein